MKKFVETRNKENRNRKKQIIRGIRQIEQYVYNLEKNRRKQDVDKEAKEWKNDVDKYDIEEQVY